MDAKKIVIFFMCILFGPQVVRAQYKIFYIPFDVETFVPVDSEKIEKQAHFVLEYKDSIIDQAFEKVKTSPQKDQVSAVNLRAKIVRSIDQEVIYINKPLDLLSNKMRSSGDKVFVNRLSASIAGKAKEACKKPKAKFVIKTKNCNLMGK